MTWLLSLLRKVTKQAVTTGHVATRHECADGHVIACHCFVDTTVAHDESIPWQDCPCHECQDFRRARVRYWSALYLDRMYDNHLRRQSRSRRRMNAAQATVVDPEIAQVTKVDPEFAIVTKVEAA